MTKFNFWVIVAVTASLGGMVAVQHASLEAVSRKPGAILSLHQRQGILSTLSLGLERYRRESANFRHMDAAQIAAAKSEIEDAFRDGSTQLAGLSDLLPNDRAQIVTLPARLSELLSASARAEKSIYSKDAYQKDDIRGLHGQIEKTLIRLETTTENQIGDIGGAVTNPAVSKSTWVEIAVACWILALLMILMVRNYLVHFRPLERLLRHAESLRAGRPPSAGTSTGRLSGVYGEIQASLGYLSQTVENHVKERHKFILDVVADLRHPLTLLQAGRQLLTRRIEGEPTHAHDSATEEARQLQAVDQLRRGLTILSGSLDDFGDLVEISRLDARLDETVVDLSELVQDVVRSLGGPSREQQIVTSVPAMPIWAKLDQRRMERALVQVIAKVASTIRPGSRVAIFVRPTEPGLSFRGTEIIVQEQRMEARPDLRSDSRADNNGRVRPKDSAHLNGPQTGPEVDLLKHWISEKGLSMALVSKVIHAQGGVLTASGAPGSSVRIAIRIPEERISNRGLITSPAATEDMAFKG
jgi:signal transduction histidine kinase